MPKRTSEPERSAADYIPPRPTLRSMREAVDGCRGCDLYRDATQAVFGAGRKASRVMFVGEQPGDAEDLAGEPFVGPSGRLLDKALIEAGIPRDRTYVTNAVKHFKFEMRGKRRLHQKPTATEVGACRPWLLEEIRQIKPDVIVCLGATAAQSLLGRAFRVTKQRGTFLPSEHAPRILATVHPSSILRARDDESRRREYEQFVADLRPVGALFE